jgi:hypothetical protein
LILAVVSVDSAIAVDPTVGLATPAVGDAAIAALGKEQHNF